jgi:hypothetical protein
MSAQRYPGDFDGVIAGAPVLNFTGAHTPALPLSADRALQRQRQPRRRRELRV